LVSAYVFSKVVIALKLYPLGLFTKQKFIITILLKKPGPAALNVMGIWKRGKGNLQRQKQ
jgi:hypothetical protein